MAKKKPREGSDWAGPRIGYRKIGRALKKAIRAIELSRAKRKLARKKKKKKRKAS